MNLPSSWGRMAFVAKMAYLVNTHQAKDFKDAREKLAPRRVSKPKSEPRKLWYSDN